MVKVFEGYMNPELAMHRNILILLQLSAHMDSIIDQNADQFALSETDSADLAGTGFAYLALFYDVSESFRDGEVAIFSLTAKAHYLMHICILSRFCKFTLSFVCLVFV